jgi:hypothetical protein
MKLWHGVLSDTAPAPCFVDTGAFDFRRDPTEPAKQRARPQMTATGCCLEPLEEVIFDIWGADRATTKIRVLRYEPFQELAREVLVGPV